MGCSECRDFCIRDTGIEISFYQKITKQDEGRISSKSLRAEQETKLQEEIEKAKGIAFRFLSYRMRSCKEVADKLKEKGFRQDTIHKVIRNLRRINYLNDLEFAKEFVESRLIHNPKGRAFLRYELSQKGVENKIIDEVIEGKMSTEKEENIARRLAEKVWNKKNNIETIKRKAQTYNYLARRGFPSSLIKRILEDLPATENKVDGGN